MRASHLLSLFACVCHCASRVPSVWSPYTGRSSSVTRPAPALPYDDHPKCSQCRQTCYTRPDALGLCITCQINSYTRPTTTTRSPASPNATGGRKTCPICYESYSFHHFCASSKPVVKADATCPHCFRRFPYDSTHFDACPSDPLVRLRRGYYY